MAGGLVDKLSAGIAWSAGYDLTNRGRPTQTLYVPVTWWAAFIRFFVPLFIAFVLLIQLSTLAPMIGLAIVAWSFFDKNRQGIHDKLARTVNEALKSDEVVASLKTQGFDKLGGTPEDFARTIAADVERWTVAAQAAGLLKK